MGLFKLALLQGTRDIDGAACPTKPRPHGPQTGVLPKGQTPIGPF